MKLSVMKCVKTVAQTNKGEDKMIAELLVGAVILNILRGKTKRKNRVKHGQNFFGCRYKEVSGECWSCNGTGKVHGKTCRKCGGSGEYSHRTWHPRKGEIYVGLDFDGTHKG